MPVTYLSTQVNFIRNRCFPLHFLIQIIDAAKNSIFFVFIIVSCCYFIESKGTLLFRNTQENRGKVQKKHDEGLRGIRSFIKEMSEQVLYKAFAPSGRVGQTCETQQFTTYCGGILPPLSVVKFQIHTSNYPYTLKQGAQVRPSVFSIQLFSFF